MQSGSLATDRDNQKLMTHSKENPKMQEDLHFPSRGDQSLSFWIAASAGLFYIEAIIHQVAEPNIVHILQKS